MGTQHTKGSVTFMNRPRKASQVVKKKKNYINDDDIVSVAGEMRMKVKKWKYNPATSEQIMHCKDIPVCELYTIKDKMTRFYKRVEQEKREKANQELQIEDQSQERQRPFTTSSMPSSVRKPTRSAQ